MKPRLDVHFSCRMKWVFLFGRPYLPVENEFLLNHARSGILLALQALKLAPHSRVGVMAYNCHTVFNAVAQADCIPVFLDVTDGMTIDVEDLNKKVSGLSALVVTHLFGIQNDVALIRSKYPHLPIIEDCAHAYGITDIQGDFAVFSIGQGKLPSLGDGGILLVKNDSYLEAVKRLYDQLPEYGLIDSAKLFCSMSFRSFLYRPVLYSLTSNILKRIRGVPDGREWITPKRMCSGIKAMYQRVLPSIEEEIDERLAFAQRHASELSSISGVNAVYYGLNAFMLIATCENVGAVQYRMLKEGVETATHFSNCLEWASQFGYEKGTCPKTEKLVHALLMIPAYGKR